MKLSELHINEEETADMSDMYNGIDNTADENSEVGLDARDITHKDKAKIMKIGRGENFKKAKSIAANAKADARATDAENEDTPHTTGATFQSMNMRLT